MNLDIIKARCEIDEDTGCWHWTGALTDDRWPRIYAPNLAKPGQPMETQTGRRVVWQLHTGQPIPEKHRVHGICDDPQCLNPQHMRCGPAALWGAHLVKTGKYKNKAVRRLASRTSSRLRSKLTPELIQTIQLSAEPARVLGERLGLSRSLVSRARRGETKAWQGQTNPFSGLLDRRTP